MKFGGMKFIETAHIKDMISYLRILLNFKDVLSWHRVLLLLDGIGPATARKINKSIEAGELTLRNFEENEQIKARKNLTDLFETLKQVDDDNLSMSDRVTLLSEYYRPLLQNKYDDWQKRWRDMEAFIMISERYRSLQSFLSDLAIDPPSESLSELTPEDKEEDYLSLSTIHSAKGLEWKVVFIIWALEGRFPSARSVDDIDSIEEERRLFYVACTRAQDRLIISYPNNIYDRESGFVLSEPTRFLANIDESLADRFNIVEDDDEDEDEEVF